MEDQATAIDHPKRRRRRRRSDFTPIPGSLILSENIKGDVGVLSDDLWANLCNYASSDVGVKYRNSDVRYIAVSPWTKILQQHVTDAKWTLLPVRAQKQDSETATRLSSSSSSLRFPASSPALRSFAEALDASPILKGDAKGERGFKIQMLDVEPIPLDAMYVMVDGDALNRHDQVQKKFGGGFGAHLNGFKNKGKGKDKLRLSAHEEGINSSSATPLGQEQQDRLIAAIRGAFLSSNIVRQGDLLPLPLPTHPITHVPFPPAKITLAEPVSQGLLSPNTKIVVSRTSRKGQSSRTLNSLASIRSIAGKIIRDDDEESSEHFFSAVEDENYPRPVNLESEEPTSDSDSSDKEDGSFSDDSLDNMISMSTPNLPQVPSGALSSMTAATPRPGMSRANGVSTTGSVFSDFTATTARRHSTASGMTFRVRGLVSKVPDDLLHPRPAIDEDDEARIFVDVKFLVKLGCFSGDWIKVEVASASATSQDLHWGVKALGGGDTEAVEFRPLKIYGISNLTPNATPQYPKSSVLNRRSSAIAIASRPKPMAWLSPIMLANIGQPEVLKLSRLFGAGRQNVSPSVSNRDEKHDLETPPLAREVTLLRISTPFSTERSMQTGILTALKQYFECKRRILRKGDLVALRVDAGVSRLLAHNSASEDVNREAEELLSGLPDGGLGKTDSLGVAWFRLGQILLPASSEDGHLTSDETWGSVACIEPMHTRMVQAGSEQRKVPAVLENTWEYYLNVKPIPKLYHSPGHQIESTAELPKVHVVPLRRRLRGLLAAATNPRALHLGMGPMVILVHSTQRSIGKATLVTRACSDLGIHTFSIDAFDVLTEEGAGGAEMKAEISLKSRAERAMSCGPEVIALMIRHIDALTGDRMLSALTELVQGLRVLIATTTDIDSISDGIRGLFTHELEYSAPDEGERESILREIIEQRDIRLANDVDLSAIAIKSAALVGGDLVDIVERAAVARQNRLDSLVRRINDDKKRLAPTMIRDLLVSGGESACCVTKSDFDIAVEAARKNFADAIGAPKIPNVSWDDVGGLENVKDAVMETIQLPLERPELFAKGMKKRSGILFYGPPGTGKTLLAKAIATEFSLNFFSVKGPELLNMYIGESEANVRRVFQRARDARPCVVFFDELDSVAPKRGNQGDSGGVMDRIVSQLLAELDGMSDGEEGAGGVFVIGATNRPDLLDQALLRPGRFDKMLYLGVSDTHDKQLTILEALTRKFNVHPDMSLHRVAESLPFTYTGADLYALCSDAMLKAITRQASAINTKIQSLPNGPVTTAYFFDHLAGPDDVAVMVTEMDFSTAQKELVGSVR